MITRLFQLAVIILGIAAALWILALLFSVGFTIADQPKSPRPKRWTLEDWGNAAVGFSLVAILVGLPLRFPVVGSVLAVLVAAVVVARTQSGRILSRAAGRAAGRLWRRLYRRGGGFRP